MNAVELACVRGCREILQYFVEELNLKSIEEFSPEYEGRTLEQMYFIYVPIAKKDSGIFEILLDIPTLWTYEQLSQILIFLKQVKWREGLTIFFKS